MQTLALPGAGVLVGASVARPLKSGEPLAELRALRVAARDGDTPADADAQRLVDALPVTDREMLGDAVGEGEPEGERDGRGDALCDGVAEPESAAEKLDDVQPDGDAVGAAEREPPPSPPSAVGESDAALDVVGAFFALPVADALGRALDVAPSGGDAVTTAVVEVDGDGVAVPVTVPPLAVGSAVGEPAAVADAGAEAVAHAETVSEPVPHALPDAVQLITALPLADGVSAPVAGADGDALGVDRDEGVADAVGVPLEHAVADGLIEMVERALSDGAPLAVALPEPAAEAVAHADADAVSEKSGVPVAQPLDVPDAVSDALAVAQGDVVRVAAADADMAAVAVEDHVPSVGAAGALAESGAVSVGDADGDRDACGDRDIDGEAETERVTAGVRVADADGDGEREEEKEGVTGAAGAKKSASASARATARRMVMRERQGLLSCGEGRSRALSRRRQTWPCRGRNGCFLLAQPAQLLRRTGEPSRDPCSEARARVEPSSLRFSAAALR